MSEEFADIQNVFNENNIFEIDEEENIMKGKAFLKEIEEIRHDVMDTISSELDSLFYHKSINLNKIEDSESDSVTYEIKALVSEKNQLIWKTKKIRFRLLVESSIEQNTLKFQSPLDDIRQSIQTDNHAK